MVGMYYRNFSIARNGLRKISKEAHFDWLLLVSVLGCGACTPGVETTGTQLPTTETETSHTGTKTVDIEEVFEWDGAPPTNILMISVDTWRKDAFDYFSEDEDILTPVLNGLVEHSVILENHQSCSSWTYPSVICVMTGTDLLSVGLIPGPTPSPDPVPKEQWILPRFLNEQGYNTHLVSSSSYLCGNNIGESFGDGLDCLADFSDEVMRNATAVREKAVVVLDSLEKSDAPWFLHLHMVDPHTPLLVPSEAMKLLKGLPPLDFIDLDLNSAQNSVISTYWRSLTESEQEILLQHLSVRYDVLSQFVDTEIGNILAAVEGLGALEDTLVVFWADHGESMFERGRHGHGTTLYNEEANVMAMYYSPRLKGRVWSERTIHQDITPTILQTLTLPVSEELKGRVVGTRDSDKSIMSYLLKADTFQLSASRGSFRMHYDWESGSKELYNTDKDPMERDNVYNFQHPMVDAIGAELDLIIDQIDELIDIKGPTDPNP
jgi:arylsulfatase A-like enzyme